VQRRRGRERGRREAGSVRKWRVIAAKHKICVHRRILLNDGRLFDVLCDGWSSQGGWSGHEQEMRNACVLYCRKTCRQQTTWWSQGGWDGQGV
jgi:hypothetical protein